MCLFFEFRYQFTLHIFHVFFYVSVLLFFSVLDYIVQTLKVLSGLQNSIHLFFGKFKFILYHDIFYMIQILEFSAEFRKKLQCLLEVILTLHKFIDVGRVGFKKMCLIGKPLSNRIVSFLNHERNEVLEYLQHLIRLSKYLPTKFRSIDSKQANIRRIGYFFLKILFLNIQDFERICVGLRGVRQLLTFKHF